MSVFRFTLVRGLRSPVTLGLLVLLPAVLVLVPVVPAATLPLGLHLYGQLVLFSAFLLVRSTMEDRLNGVLQRIAASPVSFARYLGETLLADGVLLALQNALMVGLVFARYGLRFGHPLLQLGALACFSLVSIAFCLAGFSLAGRREIVYSSLPVAITLLSLLGGLYAPVQVMPEGLRRAAMLTPPYWLIEALSVLPGGGPPARYLLCLAIMLLFAMAFLVVGSRRRTE